MSSLSHQHLLLTSLTSYFGKNAESARLFHDVVMGASPLSLRVIDWFVTHYAKAAKVIYFVDDQGTLLESGIPDGMNAARVRKVSLYLDYRAQLRSFTKMMFDPFRRHHRITFVLQANPLVTVETTVGQLNFFRWAIQNQVLTYIQNHLQDIESHMSCFQAARKDGIVHAKPLDKAQAAPLLKPNLHPNAMAPIPPPFIHTKCFLRFD
jgi:hypothetical protein